MYMYSKYIHWIAGKFGVTNTWQISRIFTGKKAYDHEIGRTTVRNRELPVFALSGRRLSP